MAATLVIGDDSAVARMIARRSLAPLGLHIVEAASGNAVIRALNEQRPALLLLDIAMPPPDGVSVLRRMRASSEFEHTPVIICTVEGGPKLREELAELRVSAHILKPYKAPALLAAVQAALAGH